MKLDAVPSWSKVMTKAGQVGVDRAAGIIYGYTVAELGPFKTPGRGEFNAKSLSMIAEQMNANAAGVKVRYTHPSLSADGLGNFLGRGRNAWVDGNKVRANLHFDPTALQEPIGGGKPKGVYLMDLAESDPTALGSSLVLQVKEELQLTPDGKPATDANGDPLPPIWYPTKIHASDIVDEGDAVHSGLLSAGSPITDDVVRLACQSLDNVFADQSREVIDARVKAWLSRYLDNRFGPAQDLSNWKRRIRLSELQ